MTNPIDPTAPDGTAEPSLAAVSDSTAVLSAGPGPLSVEAAATPFLPMAADPSQPGLGAEGPAGLRALARVARQLGNAEQAVALYREAAFLDSDDPAAAIEMALYDAELGRHRDAVETLERAVRRHPELAALRFHLGATWRRLAEPEKAAMQLRRSLALDPEDLLGAAAELATLDAGTADLPATYIRALFDQYADDFERNLIENLGYRGPGLLRRAVERCWPIPAGGADILDLGCGIGLAATAFRDVARRIDGVDLSPRMIEKAARRGVYDSLEVADAVAAMAVSAPRWNLILAADMLVYYADLAPLFSAAARALPPGGALAATAETAAGTAPVLKQTRRFGHPESHLRQAAATAGLRVALLEPASARTEKGQPVPGHVLVLAKDA